MRYELSDYEWSVIRPMLPNKPRGVPRVNDRRAMDLLRLATIASSAGGVPLFGTATIAIYAGLALLFAMHGS
jgi:hypothetical protein